MNALPSFIDSAQKSLLVYFGKEISFAPEDSGFVDIGRRTFLYSE
jgi:hypothetical protein